MTNLQVIEADITMFPLNLLEYRLGVRKVYLVTKEDKILLKLN